MIPNDHYVTTENDHVYEIIEPREHNGKEAAFGFSNETSLYMQGDYIEMSSPTSKIPPPLQFDNKLQELIY